MAGPWQVADFVAEAVGFEPTVSFPTHDFQSCRFGRSRTPPCPARSEDTRDYKSRGHPPARGALGRDQSRSARIFIRLTNMAVSATWHPPTIATTEGIRTRIS